MIANHTLKYATKKWVWHEKEMNPVWKKTQPKERRLFPPNLCVCRCVYMQ